MSPSRQRFPELWLESPSPTEFALAIGEVQEPPSVIPFQ